MLRYIPIDTLADFHNIFFSFCRRKRKAARRNKKYVLCYIPINTLADFYNFLFNFWRKKKKVARRHTAGSDTIFVQIYMDPPPGVPGVSKNQIFFSTNKTAEFLR